MRDLSFLPANDASALAEVLAALQRGLGEKLRSVLLVGAAVPPARHAGRCQLELLVVVSDLHVAALSNLARELRGGPRFAVRLQVLTERELLRAADVFTLELADYRARHVLLHGQDPFGTLHYTGAELRGSIEHALRALARRMREGVLSGAIADAPAAGDAFALVHGGIELLGQVAPYALGLLGELAPSDENALLTALARRAQVDASCLLGAVRLIREGNGLVGLGTLADVLEVVEATIALVDTVGADS